MRSLQLVYALLSTIWVLYAFQKITGLHVPETAEHLRGAVLCILLIVVLPTVLGYLLFFRAVPWVNRLVRR